MELGLQLRQFVIGYRIDALIGKQNNWSTTTSCCHWITVDGKPSFKLLSKRKKV
jgi:hypothetical protein